LSCALDCADTGRSMPPFSSATQGLGLAAGDWQRRQGSQCEKSILLLSSQLAVKHGWSETLRRPVRRGSQGTTSPVRWIWSNFAVQATPSDLRAVFHTPLVRRSSRSSSGQLWSVVFSVRKNRQRYNQTHTGIPRTRHPDLSLSISADLDPPEHCLPW
jgi:hypothetical protein